MSRLSPRLRLGCLLALLAVFALGQAGDLTGRAARIGEQLICTCGCTQGALVCNHVGCPVVTQMRNEIVQRAASSDSDELVLQSFVQEYGTQVLANPTTHGFNLVAWIMPWVGLGLGLILVLYFVRRFRRAPAPAAAAAVDPGVQSRIQAQIEAELEAELGPGPRAARPKPPQD